MAKDKRKPRDKRFAIVVMGMHRSGTSALAGVLARLGCDAPKDLMPALPQNPKGFYESLSINSFNDTVLSTAGFTWYTWQEFNKAWFRSPKAVELMDRVGTLLGDAFGSSRLIVLKDPRISLLVPFWHKALGKNSYTPLYLHIHRHPVDVAKSIDTWAAVSNDRLPGYSPQYGQLLWLRYVLEAEATTRSQTRHFTSYARVMQDWRDVANRASEALDVSWPSLSYHVEDSVAGFLEMSLDHAGRRAETLDADQRMTPWVASTFEILERWAKTGEDPKDHVTLDAIIADLNSAAPAFSPVGETSRKNAFILGAKLRTTEEERDKVSAAILVLEDITGELKHRTTALESALAQRRSEVDDAGRLLSEARDENGALNRALGEVRAAHDKMAAERELVLRDTRNAKIRDEQVMRDQLAAAVRNVRKGADEATARAEAESAELRLQNEKALQRQRATEEHVQALLQSFSWRLTGPLRKIVTALRGRRA